MSKQVNIRMDSVHLDLLERMVEKLEGKGVSTNKTDVIQKAVYYFAREVVLGSEEVSKIVDRHYASLG